MANPVKTNGPSNCRQVADNFLLQEEKHTESVSGLSDQEGTFTLISRLNSNRAINQPQKLNTFWLRVLRVLEFVLQLPKSSMCHETISEQ